ncbi:hypothetical protein D3C77_358580 [compost metagenome]
MDDIGILRAVHRQQAFKLVLLSLAISFKYSRADILSRCLQPANIFDRLRPGDHAAVNRRDQRVGSKPVRPMILILALTRSKQSRDIRHLVVVDPHAAHGVMHCREYFHRNFTRVVPHKLLINLNNSAELNIKLLRILVRQIEVYHVLAVNAQLLLDTDVEYFPSSDISWHQVAVRRIFLFEEVPRLAFFVSPDPSPFTTSRFRHEAQLIIPRNGCRVNLNEFPVRVMNTLLIHGTRCSTCINDRVRRFSKNNTRAACRQNNRIGCKGNDLHRAKILPYNTAAYAFVI